MHSSLTKCSSSQLSTIRQWVVQLSAQLSASFWPLFITATLLIFVGLGLRDPWPADEPRFALIAKEMVETGQWFFPARGQELYPDKPPMFMWSIALFYWITGSIRVAFLLPSALSALLTIFLVYDIGKRLWNKKTGLVAGWCLLFSFQFLLQAKAAQIDAMVCAWITLGCYGLLRYCLVDAKIKWYGLAWFFMGIGVITKGVGFLPLLMLLPYAAYRIYAKGTPSIVSASIWSWMSGPLIMLFAIGLWFIPMLIIVANSDNASFELYRDNILFKQTVRRYAYSWHHLKPVWYYITSVVPVFWLPLSLTIPWLIKPWITAIKQLDPRIILPLGWVVLVLIFFSFSPGKRGVYILPALPMLALSVAPFYRILLSTVVIKHILLAIVICASTAVFIFGLMGILDLSVATQFTNKLEIQPWRFFMITGGLSLVCLIAVWQLSTWLAWPMFVSVIWLTYSTYGYALRNELSTPISIYQAAAPYLTANPEIALISFSEQFILFSPYPIYHFGYHTPPKQQLAAAYQWQDNVNRYLLLEDVLVDTECFDIKQAFDLGFAHRRHWVLLPSSAKLAQCESTASNLPVYSYGAEH
jgi:hypothetical protein